MGKKRKKEVKVITMTLEKTEESDCPKCFGNKEKYCIKELCGDKWFELCTSKEPEDVL